MSIATSPSQAAVTVERPPHGELGAGRLGVAPSFVACTLSTGNASARMQPAALAIDLASGSAAPEAAR